MNTQWSLDEVEALMRRWGREYGERSGDFVDIERDSPDVHPLARARHFAPGSRGSVLESRYRFRSGHDRRTRMGAAAGLDRAVPAWACDPIAARESRPDLRTPWHVSAPADDPFIAVAQLHVMDMVQDPRRTGSTPWGYALQARYGIRGAKSDRAAWVAERIEKKVSTRAFDALVGQALADMQRRLNG